MATDCIQHHRWDGNARSAKGSTSRHINGADHAGFGDRMPFLGSRVLPAPAGPERGTSSMLRPPLGKAKAKAAKARRPLAEAKARVADHQCDLAMRSPPMPKAKSKVAKA